MPVPYHVWLAGGKQYVAVTSGAATRFWRVPPAAATVVVFSLPKIDI
jgi:hypothetical protein